MTDYGMICEWNPLHLGHLRLIDEARSRGADRVVCVMSGNTVQRGEFAVADRYLRAEAAIRCGVDLVLELPFPWCSGSAESFAKGGVSILRHFADCLIFGSECGDLSTLSRGADAAADEGLREAYRSALRQGEPAAEAYGRCLAERGITGLSSNDLLGVEYLRQSRALGASLRWETLRRAGTPYGDEQISEGALPSATAIRRLWEMGRYEDANRFMPPAAAQVYARGREEGRTLSAERVDAALLSYFRLQTGEDFQRILGCEGGLAHRICRLAREQTTLSGLLSELKNKRYTDAKLQRVLLYCLFGVTAEDLEGIPSYTTVLGANEKGRSLLRERSRSLPEGFSVVTKPADAPKDTRQAILAESVDALYTLCTTTPSTAFSLMKRSPLML